MASLILSVIVVYVDYSFCDFYNFKSNMILD